MPVEIFISHNFQDRHWTDRLAQVVLGLGIKAYLAEDDPKPGASLAEKIQAAIRRCDAVIVLISENSVNAPYVREEIGYALGRGKLVIPLVQPEISIESLAMLQGVEYIPFDFSSLDNDLSEINKVLNRLILERKRKEDQDNAILFVAVAALVAFGLASSN